MTYVIGMTRRAPITRSVGVHGKKRADGAIAEVIAEHGRTQTIPARQHYITFVHKL